MAEAHIVGREREVERLRHAVEAAAEGRGSLWFLTGEPGIGKSRLAEEVAQLARDRGMRAFWGRCWEAGGAPAYWPWVQVLRGVCRTAERGQLDPYADVLGQLLPELFSNPRSRENADLRPDQARFQLMDAIGNVLADAAARLPMVVVLEDLHVADVSTVLLLEFLGSTVRHQPLLIVGTFRDAALSSAAAGTHLRRTAQRAERIALDRLTLDDVVEFLTASGETASSELAAALHATTEGHPLFLVEVTRLWRSRGRAPNRNRLAIPRSVRTAIEQRLATVSRACLRTLRLGAIVGREFDTGLLEACYGEDGYLAHAQEATDTSILIEVAPQRYRFAHFLIRELVYEAIPAAERTAAHARLAETLQTRARAGEPRWSEIAHHLVASGRHEDAAAAYRRAGARALQQLAFDEAVEAHEHALRAAEETGGHGGRSRAAMWLELGHAQMRAGRLTEGKATCERVAALARELGDGELLARAALEHGAQLVHARIDAELISLLGEALEALPSHDSALRARVMARLAAAQQPAPDPEGPIQIARDAIAMARRVGDRRALLDTLRSGGSALVDLGDLEERVALDREHAALGDELGNPVEALRGTIRSVMDYLELERLDDAYRAIRACGRFAADLDHPAYLWRPVALRAMCALWEGQLGEAGELMEEARSIGEAFDPNALAVYVGQRTRLLQYFGRFDEQLPLLSTAESLWSDSEIGRITFDLIVGAEHLLARRTDIALRRFDPEAARRVLRQGDHTVELTLSRLAVAAADGELAEHLLKQLRVRREHLVTGGVMYMTIEGPTSWALASLARFLGRVDEASAHYEHALDVAQRNGGRPVSAFIAVEYARHLLEVGGDPSVRRARELGDAARSTAAELGMDALHGEATELLGALPGAGAPPQAPSSQPEPLSMHQVGDSWLVTYGNVEFHLKDVRGVQLLATLVRSPGREFHVLDLTAGQRANTSAIDTGDAGEVLDEEARRQYGKRIRELREELEEAEGWNDSGRAQRAREELAFLERQLSQAVGLGGKERRTGSAAERARVNVQRRIRDAIRRIESYHPGLAKHLSRAVRTGAYCRYEP